MGVTVAAGEMIVGVFSMEVRLGITTLVLVSTRTSLAVLATVVGMVIGIVSVMVLVVLS